MDTAERIYAGVKGLPEALADQVLEFVLFLEQKYTGQQVPGHQEHTGEQQAMADIRRLAQAAQKSFPALDKESREREFAALRREWDRAP